MLKKFNVTNYENVQFKKDPSFSHVLLIVQLDEYSYSYKEEIGRFDFFNKEGYLQLLNGTKKEYKQFNALLKNFFNYNEYFMWNSVLVEDCKKEGNKLIKSNKKQLEKELKEEQTNKAFEYISNLKNKDEKWISSLKMFKDKTDNELIEIINNSFKNAISNQLVNDVLNAIKEAIKEINKQEEQEKNTEVEEVTTENNTTFIAYNRSFSTWLEAYQYCKDNDFDHLYIEEVAIMQPLTDNTEHTTDNEHIVYHYYNQTFDTYIDAYNYAIRNMSPVTMVLPSNHPTMNNERLMQLENEYVFAKFNMSLDNMKEYYNYISMLPDTLDKEDRYYKLKSWIERKESRLQSIEREKQRQKEHAISIDNMLKDLYSIGMTKKEYSSLVTYYLNDKKVYSWSSGISIDKMYNELLEVYNQYYIKSEAI